MKRTELVVTALNSIFRLCSNPSFIYNPISVLMYSVVDIKIFSQESETIVHCDIDDSVLLKRVDIIRSKYPPEEDIIKSISSLSDFIASMCTGVPFAVFGSTQMNELSRVAVQCGAVPYLPIETYPLNCDLDDRNAHVLKERVKSGKFGVKYDFFLEVVRCIVHGNIKRLMHMPLEVVFRSCAIWIYGILSESAFDIPLPDKKSLSVWYALTTGFRIMHPAEVVKNIESGLRGISANTGIAPRDCVITFQTIVRNLFRQYQPVN